MSRFGIALSALSALAVLAIAGCGAMTLANPAVEGVFEIRPVLAATSASAAAAADTAARETTVADAAAALAAAGLDSEGSAEDALAWFAAGDCGATPPEPTVEVAAACDEDGVEAFLLGPTAVTGESISGTQYDYDADHTADQLVVSFDDEAAADLAEVTTTAMKYAPPQDRIAIVVKGDVAAAPQVRSVIETGEIVIVGGDLSKTARALGLPVED